MEETLLVDMDSYHILVRTTQALQIVLFHYFIRVLAVEYDIRRWASGFVFFKYYCRYCLLFILRAFILCILAVYLKHEGGRVDRC